MQERRTGECSLDFPPAPHEKWCGSNNSPSTMERSHHVKGSCMVLASASRTKSSRARRPLQIGPDKNTVREELRSDQQVLALNLRATAPASRLHLYTATAIQAIKRRLETTQALVRFTSRQSSETAQYIDACGWRDLARHENVPGRCAAITRTAAGRQGLVTCMIRHHG
jgi:hypothetical protein